MRILIVLCLLLCAGCASQNALLARQDYHDSEQAYLHGDDKDALLDLPRGREDGDFITSEEKAYLSLIQGKPLIDGLQKQETLQRQFRLQQTHLSQRMARHTRTFFDARRPQDYQPAAYERVWLHLLLGWGYADQGKYTEAAAEAHLARKLLALPPGSEQHFDDPMLRLFLAGLWTMCGQWQEARTDFHAAWDMDNSLKWVKSLANRAHAPAQLFIVLGGPGPVVTWTPALGLNPLRAARKVKFVLRGRKSALTLQDAHGLEIIAHLSPDARHWYAHPLTREGELPAVLQDLDYGGKGTARGGEGAFILVGDTAKDFVAGVAGGAVLGPVMLFFDAGNNAGTDPNATSSASYTEADFRMAAQVGAVLGGLGGLGYGVVHGYHTAAARFRAAMNPAPRFRYVRFLPEYLWMGWSDQPVAFPVRLRTPRQAETLSGPTVVNGTAVTLAQLADTYDSSICRYSSNQGSIILLGAPDASGRCPAQPDY